MKTRDVLVVGGSTSGLFAARLLAAQGRGVTVLERAPELDPDRRTLIATDELRPLIGSTCERAVVNEIRRYELFADGRVGHISLRRPDLIVERAELIRGLADSARAAGARIQTGRRFVGWAPGSRSARIRHASEGGAVEEVDARIVVGADGASSDLARSAGWVPRPTAPLVQAIVRPPRDLSLDTTRVWFRPEDTPYFYWLIPESPERAALGVIGEDGAQTRERLGRFLEEKGLEPIEFQAARVPIYSGWAPVHRKVEGAEVYLVGDAAGHVKVSTVGGLVTGLRGAAAVAKSISRGRPAPELRSLRRELNAHLLARRVLHGFSQDDYVRLLDLIGGSVSHLLGSCTRDEPTRLLWRAAVAQPRLLLLAVRGLLMPKAPLSPPPRASG